KLKVTGELTIKDITRPVVLDVTFNKAADHPMLKAPAIGFDATATILRSEFGEGAYMPNDGAEVTLRITTDAHAKAKCGPPVPAPRGPAPPRPGPRWPARW